jgi:adenosylhomocysteine nucleosidase
MAMPRILTAIIAALDREIIGLTRQARRTQHAHSARTFTFFELENSVVIAGGIGLEAARRAAEAAIAIYNPTARHSVGFAGALQPDLKIGDIFTPALVIDSRDGSRASIDEGNGTLLTYTHVAGVEQKATLARAYAAQAIDMEAAAVAAAAHAHGIDFRATKVISDGFDFEMPDLSSFIDSQGRFQTASFALHVAVRPWLWPRTAALARNSNKAAKALTEYLNGHQLTRDTLESKTR